MNKGVYGKTFDFRYTPLEGENEVTAYALVSARIYPANYYPTADQIADAGSATTGHIQRVTTWTLVNDEGTGAKEYAISFTALLDATPTSLIPSDPFFIALNYTFSSGGPTVQDVEQVFIYRPNGLTGKIRVTADDIISLDDTIEQVAPDRVWIEQKIDAAIEDIVARLEARGYSKKRIFNWEKLNAAARRLAAAYCGYALAGNGNTYWIEKADRWQKTADAMFDSARVGYDIDGNDRPVESQMVQTGAVGFLR